MKLQRAIQNIHDAFMSPPAITPEPMAAAAATSFVALDVFAHVF
jgi:hypothetical protein